MGRGAEDAADQVAISRRYIGLLLTGVLLFSIESWASGLASSDTRHSTKQTSDLPVGNAPAPLALAHFPSPLHALVWRNWGLVPPPALAATIGCTPGQVVELGHAMGLSGPPEATPDQLKRSAITIIRRNWHLLPYGQLLKLLDWTPDEMDFALREDDFLFIKLGSLKPACEPIWYRPSDAATQVREKEIAEIVRRTFPEGVGVPAEPLFQFVRDLTTPLPAASTTTAATCLTTTPRICYSYFALYGDPLLDTVADPYPDALLARLAATGINGVWLQGMLSRLAPFPWDPAGSIHWERRLANLHALTQRAARHGIKIYLYINEPRAMPNRFFETHPDLKGIAKGDYTTLCTSTPAVRDWLTSATEQICSAAPGLGGFFTISMSENLTHCWSHWKGGDCPRCSEIGPATVIADLHHALDAGIRKTTSTASLVAWDWQWHNDWVSTITATLPPGTSVMSTSEWGIPIKRGGIATTVEEYSISAMGPGDRARQNWKTALGNGRPAMAKIQAGNTWELSAIPYIPAVDTVASHSVALREAGVSGLLMGWTLGGYPSPNLEVASLINGTSVSAGHAIRQVAERRYGAAAPGVLKAWTAFSEAFSHFPFHQTVVYNAPLQSGPSNLLWEKPTRYKSTMVGFPYDDLEHWRAVYPPDVFISQLTKVADGFDSACLVLQESMESSTTLSAGHAAAVAAEQRLGRAAAIHFRSVANQAQFIHIRNNLADSPTSTTADRERMKSLLHREIQLAADLKKLQNIDSRIGFEASNQYYYTGVDLAEKVLNCHHLLSKVQAPP